MILQKSRKGMINWRVRVCAAPITHAAGMFPVALTASNCPSHEFGNFKPIDLLPAPHQTYSSPRHSTPTTAIFNVHPPLPPSPCPPSSAPSQCGGLPLNDYDFTLALISHSVLISPPPRTTPQATVHSEHYVSDMNSRKCTLHDILSRTQLPHHRQLKTFTPIESHKKLSGMNIKQTDIILPLKLELEFVLTDRLARHLLLRSLSPS